MTDVQIDGTSIVSDGVATIPKSSYSNFGVVMLGQYVSPLYVNGSGYLSFRATMNDFKRRYPYPYSACACNNFDGVIKYAMCDGIGAVWTDEERLAALLRMGCTVDENGFVKWGRRHHEICISG